MSSSSVRSFGRCSRLSRRFPDVEDVDGRLQCDRGLVRALHQPDHYGRRVGRDTDHGRWPPGKETRYRSFPTPMNEALSLPKILSAEHCGNVRQLGGDTDLARPARLIACGPAGHDPTLASNRISRILALEISPSAGTTQGQ